MKQLYFNNKTSQLTRTAPSELSAGDAKLLTYDANNLTISGLSMATEGAEAYGFTVDNKTLKQFLKLCNQNTALKGKMNHSNSIYSIAGTWSNPRIEERGGVNKLVGDFRFFLSRKSDFEKVKELIEANPKIFGISFSFYMDNLKEDGDKLLLRVKEVVSADFVEDPAINPDGALSVSEQILEKEEEKTTAQVDDVVNYMDQKILDDLKDKTEKLAKYEKEAERKELIEVIKTETSKGMEELKTETSKAIDELKTLLKDVLAASGGDPMPGKNPKGDQKTETESQFIDRRSKELLNEATSKEEKLSASGAIKLARGEFSKNNKK